MIESWESGIAYLIGYAIGGLIVVGVVCLKYWFEDNYWRIRMRRSKLPPRSGE